MDFAARLLLDALLCSLASATRACLVPELLVTETLPWLEAAVGAAGTSGRDVPLPFPSC